MDIKISPERLVIILVIFFLEIFYLDTHFHIAGIFDTNFLFVTDSLNSKRISHHFWRWSIE